MEYTSSHKERSSTLKSEGSVKQLFDHKNDGIMCCVSAKIFMRERLLTYNPPIPTDLRDGYEQALRGELRWQNGILTPDIDETNYDHVADLITMHNEEVPRLYPRLYKEVDSPETNPALYLHDGGEIGGLDLSHSVPDYDKIRPRVKRRERANFRLLTREYIDDIELRAYVRALYARYEACEPDDTVMQYVHLLDKFQATRFGAEHVFSRRHLGRRADRSQQTNHLYGITKGFAIDLYKGLNGPAREDLLRFVDTEFLVLRKHGYEASVVDPYRDLIREEMLQAGS